ncbi:ubiquitin-1-specific protease [Phytophthora cinnamomi]|uniref:ubiquitin-1-specific protease n=1 Tax=Phytophthora cinnamomi TaxID=4785 RepID=UPI00355AA6C1|nr:ubiquitin-1-specific protease [Phytophthora cinnamomi]
MSAKKRRLAGGEEDAEEAKRRRLRLLQAAFGPEDRVDESNWITGALIDLMLWKFATLYPAVHFLPTSFYHFHLEAAMKAADRSPWRRRCRAHRSKRDYQVKDVLGRPVDYDGDAPLVLIVNVDCIHWNLFRVQLGPTPELQLFEPMGRLASRSGISYRSVPRAVTEWLDVCYPQHKCWMQRAVSAITSKQQVSGFDCGVACLLYADKCGRGHTGEEINAQIDQNAITSYRKQLQLQLQALGDGIDG